MLQEVCDRVDVRDVQIEFGADLLGGIATSFERADFFEEFGRRVSATSDVLGEAHQVPVFSRRDYYDRRDAAGAQRLVCFESSLAAHQVVLSVSSRRDSDGRSEERRVGKECRSRWSPYH